MYKIAFYTLGCKVNQSDTDSMKSLFVKSGYQIVSFEDNADVYVINTCVVTNNGQRRSRQIINRAVRKNPQALIVVTGCYPQTASEEVKAIEGVDLIIGNQNRNKIVELVTERMKDNRYDTVDAVEKLTAGTKFEELSSGDVTERTRAFLKIQEGCNQFCTYCIIPYARGPLRSRNLENIRLETERLVSLGFKEIVLIGIHLGCYGKENPGGPSLYDAVKTVLSVDGVRRVRLGSLESVELEERILNLMLEDKRLCSHLHLPLQSGSDSILESMHRPYDTAKFAALLRKAKDTVPNLEVTTDVIVGFPGETREQFEETLAFAKECGFSKMHIFPFSARKGTPAASFKGALTEAAKHERALELAELDKVMQQEVMQQNVGREFDVLFEQTMDGGYVEGLTDNYLRVYVKGKADLCGKIRRVKLISAEEEILFGEIID